MVSAALSFLYEAIEERGDGGSRVGLSLEANELWMMTVASGVAGEHLLRKQSFPSRLQPIPWGRGIAGGLSTISLR